MSSTLPYSVSDYSSSAQEASFSANYITAGVSNVIISISCGYNSCSGLLPPGCSMLFYSIGPDGYEATAAAVCSSQPAGNHLINGTFSGSGVGYAAVSVYKFSASSTSTSTTSTSTSTTSVTTTGSSSTTSSTTSSSLSTTSLNTSSSTSSSTTSAPTTAPSGGIIESTGEGGLGGAAGGGGVTAPIHPVLAAINTTAEEGWLFSNYTAPETLVPQIGNATFLIVLNFITRSDVGVSVDGVPYSLPIGSTTALPGGYYLNVASISSFPYAVTMSLYAMRSSGPSGTGGGNRTSTTTTTTIPTTLTTIIPVTTTSTGTPYTSNSSTSTVPGSPSVALISIGIGCIIVALMGYVATRMRERDKASKVQNPL